MGSPSFSPRLSILLLERLHFLSGVVGEGLLHSLCRLLVLITSRHSFVQLIGGSVEAVGVYLKDFNQLAWLERVRVRVRVRVRYAVSNGMHAS